jgi:hypothetical protein
LSLRRAVVPLILVGLLAGGLLAPVSGANEAPHAAKKKCKKKPHRKHCKKKGKKDVVIPAPPPAILGISPTSQDFGIPVPGDHIKRSFVVANMGGSLSGVPSASISGTDTSSYSISSNGCTTTLPVAANCSIEVELTSSGLGVKTATLTVSANPGGTVAASMTGQVSP